MNRHREVSSTKLEIIDTSPPFSSFDFIDSRFNGIAPIRRCFSIARSLGMLALTLETIPTAGIILDEVDEIAEYYPNYQNTGLVRLAFFNNAIDTPKQIANLSDENLLGYAIIKQDYVAEEYPHRWHVFEAVFKKYPHRHNCVPTFRDFTLTISDNQFTINGVLYCQQNELNKACAHVALRTLVLRHIPEQDIAYRTINELAGLKPEGGTLPKGGLGAPEIRKVLSGLNIPFFDIDYTRNNSMRKSHPYQKFLYSGIESGAGALLGFQLAGPEFSATNPPPKHIIPFYGHTFNKDTWVPDAEASYFDVGGSVGYIPSENWTSSFIGHDDNFGGSFCVPRLYVKPEQADYVVELLCENVKYSGVKAEILALYFLCSMEASLTPFASSNKWLGRLVAYIKRKKVVLRPVFASKNDYIEHLRDQPDWDGDSENNEFLKVFSKSIPENVWMIEVSITQLFPANERKIGEIVLDPYVESDANEKDNFKLFLFARFASVYLFHTNIFDIDDQPDFLYLKSEIKSHFPLMEHK